MSLISSGLALTHLVTIERNAGADGGDGWGKGTDWQPHLVDVPCRAWDNSFSRRGNEIVEGTNVVVIENLRIIVPADTDVAESDRVANVTTGDGSTLVDGPVDIRAVIPRRGVLGGYIELMLVRIG